MRKALPCVLMMALLLTACGGERQAAAEELAHRVREEYASLSGWKGVMEVTADYGDSVYDFTLDVVWRREGDTVLTVTAPELIAGVTARVGPEGAFLEYDGASLGTGPLTGDGLSPLELVPRMMGELLTGYMAACDYEREGESVLLRVVCRDPDRMEGEGAQWALYFDSDSRGLRRVEVSDGGVMVLTARLTSFAKDAISDDNGDGEGMG